MNDFSEGRMALPVTGPGIAPAAMLLTDIVKVTSRKEKSNNLMK